MEPPPATWYNTLLVGCTPASRPSPPECPMAKPHRNLKKANHGSRPANSKARKMKRKHIRT